MNRRGFFSRVFGAVAATAVAPSVFEAVKTSATLRENSNRIVGYIAANESEVWTGSFTIPYATVSQTITGVGFTPKSVIFYPTKPLPTLTSMDADGFTVNWTQVNA